MAIHLVGFWKNDITYDERGQFTLQGFVRLDSAGSDKGALTLQEYWAGKIADLIHDYHHGSISLEGLPLDLQRKIKANINPAIVTLKFIQNPDKKENKKSNSRMEKCFSIQPGQSSLCQEGEVNTGL